MIKQILYQDLPKIKADFIGFSPNDTYFGLYKEDELVSIAGFKIIGRKRVRLCSNYTFPQHRHKGYMRELLKAMLTDIIPYDIPLDARCLETSWRIYISLGFKLLEIKKYKTFDIYIMKKGEK